MRHAPSPFIGLERLLWAVLLACCLQAGLLLAEPDDSANVKLGDDNLQVGGDMPKRDWNRNLHEWGKRAGWGSIHGGWGLKRSIPSVDQLNYPPIVEKRAWQSLQGGWGKRYAPSEDDLTIQELASILEQNDNRNMLPVMDSDTSDIDIHDDEKRNWNKFSDGWGKRNKWEKFRGSWGKRDPAWSNLKGIWGKRSVPDAYAK